MTEPINETNIKDLPLWGVASLVEFNWPKPYFGAVPYIRAMHSLDTVRDYYGADPGSDIVARFLCNAGAWRGDIARLVKKELNRRLKARP